MTRTFLSYEKVQILRWVLIRAQTIFLFHKTPT